MSPSDTPYLLEATFVLQPPSHPERDRVFDPTLHFFVRATDTEQDCSIKLLLSEEYFKYYSPRQIVNFIAHEELSAIYHVLTHGKHVYEYAKPLRAFFDVGKTHTLPATRDIVEKQIRGMTKVGEEQGDTFLLLRNIRQSLYEKGILTE